MKLVLELDPDDDDLAAPEASNELEKTDDGSSPLMIINLLASNERAANHWMGTKCVHETVDRGP